MSQINNWKINTVRWQKGKKQKTVYQRKGLPAEQAPSWPYPDSNKMLIYFSDSTE